LDLEHTFRFLKQGMDWTTPGVRHPGQADRWTWLVVAAYTQLRLAHTRVANPGLPLRATLRCGPDDAGSGTPGGFDTFGSAGDAREATETLREVSWKA
jgi:hypothetical protein